MEMSILSHRFLFPFFTNFAKIISNNFSSNFECQKKKNKNKPPHRTRHTQHKNTQHKNTQHKKIKRRFFFSVCDDTYEKTRVTHYFSLFGPSLRFLSTYYFLIWKVIVSIVFGVVVLSLFVSALAFYFFRDGSDDDNESLSSLSFEKCPDSLSVGSTCWMKIEDLHPTQFSMGYEEINCKAIQIAEMTDSQFQEYLESKIVPIIIGPDGLAYMIDRHHTTASIHRIERTKEMIVLVREDWSHLNVSEFWSQMINHNYCWLFNPQQSAEVMPQLLPKNVWQLENDPYRGLAYFSEKCGGFMTQDVPFEQFSWADYYRKTIPTEAPSLNLTYCSIFPYDSELCWPSSQQREWMQKAIPEAVALSLEPAAADLPGYQKGKVKSIPCFGTELYADWSC